MDKSKSTPEIPEVGFFSLLIVYAAVATAAVVFLLFVLPEFWLLWAVPVLFLPAVINKVLKRELEPDPAANLKSRYCFAGQFVFKRSIDNIIFFQQ